MFKIFKVKTKLEIQLEEYVQYKIRFSPLMAETHGEIILKFIKGLKYKTITEITLEDIDAYHTKLRSETTQYTTTKAMQSLRGFLRYHKWQTEIQADEITNQGVVKLQPVAKNGIIDRMNKKKRVGRPPNVAFIKEVKNLVDKQGLGIRAIARAKLRNPSIISRAYNYDLSRV